MLHLVVARIQALLQRPTLHLHKQMSKSLGLCKNVDIPFPQFQDHRQKCMLTVNLIACGLVNLKKILFRKSQVVLDDYKPSEGPHTAGCFCSLQKDVSNTH
jgi:hypothetical protein